MGLRNIVLGAVAAVSLAGLAVATNYVLKKQECEGYEQELAKAEKELVWLRENQFTPNVIGFSTSSMRHNWARNYPAKEEELENLVGMAQTRVNHCYGGF